LQGLKPGQVLLKLVPFAGQARSHLPHNQQDGKIVACGFHSPAKHFELISESTIEITAVQRDWRGFRIAPCSRERDDATLPKIWTRSAWLRSRQ
jgi:hypothetical protein